MQVGVISLGTSTSSGGVREVKIDILGAMDYENKKIRLKALDHLNVESTGRANEVYLKKFQRILETLTKWVHPKATIVTDFAIDKNMCAAFGFTNMTQSTDPKFSNGHVMDYLRFVVPRMFQNTLNLLSRSIIQQFLDELVWRETWGHIPSKAYDAIIENLAEQTKLEGPEDVSVRYTLIASNPNKDWKYANWPTNMNQASVWPKKIGVGVKTVHRVVKTPTGQSVVIPKKPGPASIQMPTTTAALAPVPATPTTTADGSFPELAKIALEPYYYGTIQGDPSKQKPTGLFGAFLTECVLCSKDLFSSSAFTNHLVHHALNPSSAIQADATNSLRLICRFCMKPVVNLDNHVRDFHKHSHLTKKTMCKICNTIHRDEAALISHMIYTHVELDMPYFCEICSYRTSVYQDMVIHFEKCHNKDTCVQCPFCLKIVRFAARNGEDIPNNQMYFIQHIQKHTIARQVRKCEKCALSFTNLSTLKNHQEFFHLSCVDYENVERYDLNPNDFILMSAPLVDPPPPMSLADTENFTLKGVPLAPSIRVSDDLKVFLCAECDGPITSKHFCVRMTCTKCRFQTCCANAIKDHNASAHSPSPLASGILPIKHFIGGRPIMARALYCNICLFSTKNGDRLATHLEDVHQGYKNAKAVGDKRKASSLMMEPSPEAEDPAKTPTQKPEPESAVETPEVTENMDVDDSPLPKRRSTSVSE